MSELQSPLEERVVATVREGRDEIVGIASDLVAFDTTAREAGRPAARRGGAAALPRRRVWRRSAPRPTCGSRSRPGTGNRHVPVGLSFVGRPQLAAHLRGAGGGRSLLLNGHIDAVSAEPRELWAATRSSAVERDGRLYGRGTCDMKGGIAGMLFALETLHRLGVKLAGDVVFCTVTDEESSGAGGFAARRPRRQAPTPASAPSPPASTPGSPAAARSRRRDRRGARRPRRDGAAALARGRRRQRHREGAARARGDGASARGVAHPPRPAASLLSPGTIVPTIIKGGEWSVTYPSSCEVTFEVMYLPGHVDADGTGKPIEDEVLHAVNAAADADPWLAEHPLQWFWDNDVVPAEVPADHPLVGLCLAAGADARAPRHGRRAWTPGTTPPRSRGAAARRRSASAPATAAPRTPSTNGSPSTSSSTSPPPPR